MMDWRHSIGAYLTPSIRNAVESLATDEVMTTTDLRLRSERPAVLCGIKRTLLPVTTVEDVRAMADAMLGHAVYARQEELRQGYVTLPGGHRAGLCGRVATKDGSIRAIQDIAFIAVRIARAIPTAGKQLLTWVVQDDRPVSTLLVSPPGYGKTTMLRDVARLLSIAGFSVCIVDERSELAACDHGVPMLDVGPCTDILDGCPKADGMCLVLRAMSPQVIVTDELGRPEDGDAVADAARCGVAVIASAHGYDFADLEARPMFERILKRKAFSRIITLDRLGHIGAVYDAAGKRLD